MDRQVRTGVTVQIVAHGTCDVAKMRDLAELADQLVRADLPASATTVAVPGVKDEGLVTAISLAGLVLSSVSTVVSVLVYWASTKPQYRVTLETDAATYELSNLDKQEVRTVIQELEAGSSAANVVVKVAKG